VTVLILVVGVTPAVAAPLNWSGPQQIDSLAPFGEPAYLTGVSCPTTELCVGVDDIGNVITSTDPAGGTSTWATSTIRKTTFPNGFNAVSCASAALCVAVDGSGNLATTTDPAAGASTWSLGRVAESYGLADVSCPTESFCAATGGFGEEGEENLVYSTDPKSGVSAWQALDIGGDASIKDISCVSASFCLAAEAYGGNIYTSTEPTAGPGAWTKTSLTGAPAVESVDCPSTSLCVIGTFAGVLTSTDPTGGSGAWDEAAIGQVRGISCPSTSLCVGMQNGHSVSSTNPTGGSAAWHASVASLSTSGPVDLSCADDSFCASTIGQDVAYSSDPTNTGAPAWQEGQVDFEGFNQLNAMSCPSASLCVAGDSIGRILTSTSPAGGAWSATRVANGQSYESSIQTISCVSPTFCVAGGGGGKVYTSTNPTGGASDWHAATVAQNVIDGISCASSSLCVAVDNEGNVISSTNPAGGASAWQRFPVDTETNDSVDLGGPSVACPSTSLCVGVNPGSGNLISSTDPTGGSGAWSVSKLSEGLAAVACPATTFCVALSAYPNQLSWFSSNPTGGAAAWTSSPLEAVGGIALACPSTALCAAGGYVGPEEENVASTSDPAAGGATWEGTNTDPGFFGDTRTSAIACATTSLCILGDQRGNVYVGTPSGEATSGASEASGESSGSGGGSPALSAPGSGSPSLAQKQKTSAGSRPAVAGSVATVKSGTATITLQCSAGSGCSGVAKLEVPGTGGKLNSTAQARTKRSVTVIGSAHFRIGAGKKASVRIPLTRRGKALLATSGRKGLRAVLAGTGIKKRTVTLRVK
jgi:hypothetical protein